MIDWRRVRGLKALVQDAVEHGSRAVEQVHLKTAARPFALLELIPGVAGPSKVVHAVHDAVVSTTYETVRFVNGAAGGAVDVALGMIAGGDDSPER